MDEKEKITVDESVPENNSEPQDEAVNTNTAEDEKAKEAHRDDKVHRKILVITGILLALILLVIVLVLCLRGCRDGSGEGTPGGSGITASSRSTATSAESTAASTNRTATTAKSTTDSAAPAQTQNSTGTQAPTQASAQATTATPAPANSTKAPTKALTKAPTAAPTNPPANNGGGTYHTAWGTRPYEFEELISTRNEYGKYFHYDLYGNCWIDNSSHSNGHGKYIFDGQGYLIITFKDNAGHWFTPYNGSIIYWGVDVSKTVYDSQSLPFDPSSFVECYDGIENAPNEAIVANAYELFNM